MRRYGCWQARAASIFFERLARSGRYYYSKRRVCPLAVRRVRAGQMRGGCSSMMEATRRAVEGSCGAAEGRIRTAYDVFQKLARLLVSYRPLATRD